jgi:hypothetical protein
VQLPLTLYGSNFDQQHETCRPETIRRNRASQGTFHYQSGTQKPHSCTVRDEISWQLDGVLDPPLADSFLRPKLRCQVLCRLPAISLEDEMMLRYPLGETAPLLTRTQCSVALQLYNLGVALQLYNLGFAKQTYHSRAQHTGLGCSRLMATTPPVKLIGETVLDL